jgi:lysozyme family protein
MALFEIAYKQTRENEGGYANNGADAGGETYKGIARNFWGGLNLWRFIDQVKQELGTVHDGNKHDWIERLNARLEQIPALQTAVDYFYRAKFWDANSLTLIRSQIVANWIFDHCVNADSRGDKWAQEAAGVAIDGDIGPVTIAAINAMEPAVFLSKAEDVAAFYRLDRALANPSQIQFLPSWLRRDGVSTEEIKEVMAMAKNGLTAAEVKVLKGIIEETA